MTGFDAPLTITSETITYADLSDDLKSVHDLWNDLRQDRFAPRRQDFDLLKIPALLTPFSSVVTLEEDESCRFLFFGTGLARLDGKDLTGKTTYDIPNRETRDMVEAQNRRVIQTKSFAFALLFCDIFCETGPFAMVGRWPLSDDGEKLSGILNVNMPIGPLNYITDTYYPKFYAQ